MRKIGTKAFENSGLYDAQNEGILYVGPYCIGYNGNKPTGNLVIAEGTRIIADDAFAVCEGIFSLGLPNSLVSIGIGTFFGCTSITSITLPNSLAFIGRSAFEECSGLTFVSIPKTVTEIEYFAFDCCSHLSNIYYNAVNAVCKGKVFKGCDNLTTLNLGPDVESINANVFKNCNSAHLVVAFGDTPAVLDAGAFSEIAEDAMLMVPCGKRITYFSQWNMFPYNNIIENCDQYSISMSGVGAGGSITSSTTSAQMGEEVLLTVTPNAGMALESIEICNANDPSQTIPYYFVGKATTKIGFIMPQFGVLVRATFKTSGASVDENDSMLASIYPNPTEGLVKVEAEGIKHITITNLLGQTIYEGNANGNEFEYDFSNHKAGIYLIRIETESGVVTKKVSVER